MSGLPMKLILKRNVVAKISERDGVITIEPMRFLLPYQAKRELRSKFPKMCDHVCQRKGRA